MESSPFSIPPECEAKLRSCTTLPTPPNVAVQIMKLVKDPDLDIDDVVKVLTIDPALSIKILRMANSPLYGHQKKVQSLQKAIMMIGLNGVLSLALSFSLVKSLRREKGEGLDHTWYWRRALISGSAGLALAEACGRKDQEELFMAAFIQDIGMLVLDQVEPSLYADPSLDPAFHVNLLAHEREEFGADHAVVGSWLLAQWNFPENLVLAIRYSDEPDPVPPETKDVQFHHCVSFSGLIADLSVSQVRDDELYEISEKIENRLQLPSLAFLEIFKKVNQLVRESEPLFEIDCQGDYNPDAILERARELLVMRNIKLDQQINTMTAKI